MIHSYFKKIHLTILLLILVILLWNILNHSDKINQTIIIMAFIAHIITYIFMKSGLTSLLITIGTTFIAGIISVIYFFTYPYEFTLENLLVFCSYSVALFIIWYLSYTQQKHSELNIRLSERIEELEKYGEVESIYTYSEFKERSLLLAHACEMREEDGYFVMIRYSPLHLHVHQAIHSTIGEKIVQVIRQNVDLVGEYDDRTFVIFLQKTTMEEAEAFLAKLDGKLETKLMLDTIKITARLYHYNEFDFASGISL